LLFSILGDFEAYRKTCEEKYGVTPNYEWALDFYGGRTDEEMLGFSKIFFSNGMLDPWSGGSPTTFLSEDLVKIFIILWYLLCLVGLLWSFDFWKLEH